jgi:hypothetical protein
MKEFETFYNNINKRIIKKDYKRIKKTKFKKTNYIELLKELKELCDKKSIKMRLKIINNESYLEFYLKEKKQLKKEKKEELDEKYENEIIKNTFKEFYFNIIKNLKKNIPYYIKNYVTEENKKIKKIEKKQLTFKYLLNSWVHFLQNIHSKTIVYPKDPEVEKLSEIDTDENIILTLKTDQKSENEYRIIYNKILINSGVVNEETNRMNVSNEKNLYNQSNYDYSRIIMSIYQLWNMNYKNTILKYLSLLNFQIFNQNKVIEEDTVFEKKEGRGTSENKIKKIIFEKNIEKIKERINRLHEMKYDYNIYFLKIFWKNFKNDLFDHYYHEKKIEFRDLVSDCKYYNFFIKINASLILRIIIYFDDIFNF